MIKSNDKIYIESFLENLVVRKNLSQNTIKSYTFDLKLLTDLNLMKMKYQDQTFFYQM